MKKHIIYENGDIYNGDYIDDKMNGKGVLEYNNKDVYEGDFLNNFKHGYGVMKYVNGNIYTGQWKNNYKNGKGKIIYNDNSYYNGDWVNDKRHGKGIMVFSDKEKSYMYYMPYKSYRLYNLDEIYEGEWIDDVQSGKGIMKYKNGEIYDGEWKNGKYNGNGIMIYIDGSVYDGQWLNGIKHGKGILKKPNDKDKIIEGIWVNDIHVNEYNKKVVSKNPIILINDTDISEKDTCSYIYKNIVRDIYSIENLKTMLLYSNHGDVLINNYLRNNRKVNDFILSYFSANYEETFKDMKDIFKYDDKKHVQSYIDYFYESLKDCFLTKFDKNIIVYRGIKSIPDLKVNDVIQNNYFISTDCSIYTAERFTKSEYINGKTIGVILKIEIPKDTYVCPIFLNTMWNRETEILLNNDSCFYVKSIDNNIYNLTLINHEYIDSYYQYDGNYVVTNKKYFNNKQDYFSYTL